jgi:hypothetical protein
MSKQVLTARQFVDRAQAPDAKKVTIIRVDDNTAKFKLKTTKRLFTLTVKKGDLIQTVIDALPERLQPEIIDKKKKVDSFHEVDEEQEPQNEEQLPQ